MNKSFKVVFSKARSALMVVNEATSSIQAKGTKTVIAVAAAMVAGGAMAAEPTTVTIGDGASLVVSTTDNKAQATGTVTIDPKVSESAGDRTTWLNDTDTLVDKAAVVLKNGTFAVQYTTTTTDGKTSYATFGKTVGSVSGAGTISLKARGEGIGKNDKESADANLTVTTAVDMTEGGTIAFTTDNAAAKSQSSFKSAKSMTLGKAAEEHVSDGVQVLITTDANSNAYVGATDEVKLANVAIENAGVLELGSVNGVLTLGKGSTIKNTGKLTVGSSGGNVTFAADYSDAGKLVVTSTGSDSQAIIEGNVKGATVKLGTAATDETAQIVINGTSTTAAVLVKGGLEATDTLTLATTAQVSGTSTAGASLTAAKTNVSGTASVTTNAYGTVNLGALTIAAGKTANSLTLNTAASGTTTADSLTIAKTDTTNTAAGALTVSGAFSLLKGESVNNGTVTLNNGASATDKTVLTIAKDASFVNNETLKTADSTPANVDLVIDGTFTNNKTINASGASVTVNGTLTNTFTKAESNTDKVSGTITAEALTVANGAVVTSSLTEPAETAGAPSATKQYSVTTTTLEKGGTFVTTLNKRAAKTGENDTLEINGISFVMNGGVLGTAADAPITNVELVSGASMTFNAAYDTAYNTVKVGADGSKLTVAKDGSLKVATLDASAAATAGDVTVEEGGALEVTTKVKTGTTNGKIAVKGTMTTSLAALGYEINTSNRVAAKSDSVSSGMSVGTTGVLTITGLTGTLNAADINTLKGMTTGVSGLLDLGDVALEGVSGTSIEYSKLASFANVSTKALREATITKADGITSTASYGKVVLNSKKPTGTPATEKNLSVGQDLILTLNGTGNLVEYSDGGLTGVELASGATFVTTGTGAVIGDVTSGSSVTDAALKVAAGSLTANNVKVNTVSVVGSLEIAQAASGSYVIDTAMLDVEGELKAAAAKVTATAGNVTGIATIGELAGGALTVGDKAEKVGGTLQVTTLATGAKVTADNLGWNKDGSAVGLTKIAAKTLKGTISAGAGSIVSLGTADVTEADKAFAATGFTIAETAKDAKGVKLDSADTRTVEQVVYVNGGVSQARAATAAVPFEGIINWTGATTPSNSANELGNNSMLIIDAATVDTTGDKAVFKNGLTVNPGSVLVLNNIANNQSVRLTATANGLSGSYGESDIFFDGNMLMNADIVDGVVSVTMVKPEELTAAGLSGVAGLDAVYGMYAEGANVGNTSASAKFFNNLFSSATSAAYQNGDWNVAYVKSVMNDVAALGATTGVQTMTMDAVNQMGETVADRVSLLTQRAAGVNVWAAANGGMFEAKSLFDGAGYESDIYSGVLGVDYQFSCNAVLGAALTIGTADTDNKNSGVAASTDSDLVGFSVYASKTFADVIGVSADIGYLSASNDVTANGYGQAWKFSQDTDAFTIGLRTEVLAEVGAVKLVPHIGLRYTALSTDSFDAAFKTDIDDQNIFQMPVGVTVSGDFQTGDWTVAPKFDLSVVPTFGDKDADLKLGIAGVKATDDLAVRVIDSNPVQATLGVNATNGAWGFGLNYKLGVGSDDRMNNTFNVNVRYAF